MQRTQVWSLVQEDPTSHRATKPMHHNYWACAPESRDRNCWAHLLQLLKPVSPRPRLHNKRNHHKEKPERCSEEYPRLAAAREKPTPHWRASTAKNTHINKIISKIGNPHLECGYTTYSHDFSQALFPLPPSTTSISTSLILGWKAWSFFIQAKVKIVIWGRTRSKFQIRPTGQVLRLHMDKENSSIRPRCFFMSIKGQAFKNWSDFQLLETEKIYVMQSKLPIFHELYGDPSSIPTNVNKLLIWEGAFIL